MFVDEAEKIQELLDRYIWDDRSVKRSELLEMLESIRVTSPKTGKLIRAGTYIQYNERRMLKELNKRDIAWYLNRFYQEEIRLPNTQRRGFFES